MNKRNVDVEILEWMIGYYMILAFLLTSLVLPLIFLVPLFIVWRKTVNKQIDATNLYVDKKISKLTLVKRKFSWWSLFSLVTITLIIAVALYKIYIEYYWLTYISVPGATVLGGIISPIIDYIGFVCLKIGHGICWFFSLLFSPLESAYEWGVGVLISYDIGFTDYTFYCFLSEYIIVPLYKFFFGIGDFFCGIDDVFRSFFDFMDTIYYLWIEHAENIAIKHQISTGLSFAERIIAFLN